MAKRKRATEGKVYDKSESPKAFDQSYSDDDLKAYQTRPGKPVTLIGETPSFAKKKDVNLPIGGAPWEVRKKYPKQADYSKMSPAERRKRAGHGSRIMRDE